MSEKAPFIKFIDPTSVKFEFNTEKFKFNPAIPIPIQIDNPDEFSQDDLNIESILAGMLHVLGKMRSYTHIPYYRKFIKAARPNIRTEMTEAAILKCKNGDFALAEEVFTALEGLNPDDGVTILNLALLYDQWAEQLQKIGTEDQAKEKEEKALDYYKVAMNAEPVIPDAFFNAGFFFFRQKYYKNAKEAFDSYVVLGEDEQKKETAQEYIQKISSQNLEDDMFKQAYDLINQEKEEEALEKIRDFLIQHPKVWNAWFLLGWALRKLKRYTEAEEAFKQTIILGGDLPDTKNELAICYMEQGNLKESKKQLLEALTKEPENIKIISNLGFLALKEGNQQEAIGFFRTVLEIEPNDELASQTLASLEDF